MPIEAKDVSLVGDIPPEWVLFAVVLPKGQRAGVVATAANATTGAGASRIEARIADAVNQLERESTSAEALSGRLSTPHELMAFERLRPRTDLSLQVARLLG